MTARFTADVKRDCAAREVAQRRRVYDRLVLQRRMSREKADREIAIMQEIVEDYRAIHGDLFTPPREPNP